MVKIRLAARRWLRVELHELVLGGLWIGLWAASATPLLNFNLGFMRVGVTYVWPLLLGLTIRAPWALLLAVIGDNIALVTSGTGFSQWMPEYAVIYPAIALMAAASRRWLLSSARRPTALACAALNGVALAALLVVLVLQQQFRNTARNADSFFNFTTTAAQAVVWAMFGLVTVVNFIAAVLALMRPRGAWLVARQAQIRRYWALLSLIFAVIVVMIWLWGPFAQIRYLSVWGVPGTNYYRQYELFLIPRVLKTPLALVLYTALIAPIYTAHQQLTHRRASAPRW